MASIGPAQGWFGHGWAMAVCATQATTHQAPNLESSAPRLDPFHVAQPGNPPPCHWACSREAGVRNYVAWLGPAQTRQARSCVTFVFVGSPSGNGCSAPPGRWVPVGRIRSVRGQSVAATRLCPVVGLELVGSGRNPPSAILLHSHSCRGVCTDSAGQCERDRRVWAPELSAPFASPCPAALRPGLGLVVVLLRSSCWCCFGVQRTAPERLLPCGRLQAAG